MHLWTESAAGRNESRSHCEGAADLSCWLQVRKLKAAQKLSGSMMVHARRQSQGLSPAPSTAGLDAGGSFTPGGYSLGGTPGPFSIGPPSGETSEDEDIAVEEQAHM